MSDVSFWGMKERHTDRRVRSFHLGHGSSGIRRRGRSLRNGCYRNDRGYRFLRGSSRWSRRGTGCRRLGWKGKERELG
jgi:hypothetical protein